MPFVTQDHSFQSHVWEGPPALLRYEGQRTPIDTLDVMLTERVAVLDELKFNLIRAQQRMQDQANKKRRDVEFQVGEWVFLKLRPYRQQSLAKRRYEKLSAKFYGPYKVMEKIGKVAYKLELPDTATIHPTFHVSLLKAAKGIELQPKEIPPQLTVDMELPVTPEALKGVRKKKRIGGELEVLIKWMGLEEEENTWEDYDQICQLFPEFDLEGKVKDWPAGAVMLPPLKVYTRRNQRGHVADASRGQD